MAFKNTWVTYLDRGFKNIKASIIERLKVIVPEVTDLSDSNIFIIIIELFAGLVEQLNYYVDIIARELYITTARRYSSLIKITKLIDYEVKAKIGSTVDLKITLVDGTGNPVNATSNYILNSGIIVENSAGIQFLTQSKITIFAGSTYAIVGARQAVHVVNNNIGTTATSADQTYQLDEDYQHGTLQITIDSETWELKSTLSLSGPQDKHFMVRVNESKEAWVIFGDDTKGAIPPNGEIIYATYYICSGINGNVEAGTLTIFNASTEPLPPAEASEIVVTNPLKSAGGLNEEGIDGIRKMAPLSLRTLNRAVTQQDYKDLALLVPGVGKVETSFNDQLKTIDIYIAPSEGGTASSQLKTDVENYFLTRKMISTYVSAIAAGETVLLMTLAVTAKFRRDATETENDIVTALIEEFGFNNSDVNRKIRKSDIIALVDNLDKVDYLELSDLSTIPYPRISLGLNELSANWYVEVTAYSEEIVTWRLHVYSATEARLYRKGPVGNETFDGTVQIHATDPGSTDFTSQDLSLKLGMWGIFSLGDEWLFKTYPYNEDIVLDDNTIPIIDTSKLNIIVTEQNIT